LVDILAEPEQDGGKSEEFLDVNKPLYSELVILQVCKDIDEAYMFRSVLEGSGVEAFIPDEYELRTNPPIAIAGVRLLVRKEDVERASAILASVNPEKR
jgi:hypothetical protein